MTLDSGVSKWKERNWRQESFWGSRICKNSNMSQQLKTTFPPSPVSPAQVWVKESPKEGWLSFRKWCGSSWRVPCKRSWRNFWAPPQALRKRYSHTNSPSPSLCFSSTIWMWLQGGWVTHEHWENTKVTHTVARCQWGFHLHSADIRKMIRHQIAV